GLFRPAPLPAPVHLPDPRRAGASVGEPGSAVGRRRVALRQPGRGRPPAPPTVRPARLAGVLPVPAGGGSRRSGRVSETRWVVRVGQVFLPAVGVRCRQARMPAPPGPSDPAVGPRRLDPTYEAGPARRGPGTGR